MIGNSVNIMKFLECIFDFQVYQCPHAVNTLKNVGGFLGSVDEKSPEHKITEKSVSENETCLVSKSSGKGLDH